MPATRGRVNDEDLTPQGSQLEPSPSTADADAEIAASSIGANTVGHHLRKVNQDLDLRIDDELRSV